MGNESGEWIMHGMKWDNPECIHSVDEAIKYINEFGFLPLFKNDIDGFCQSDPVWWSDNPETPLKCPARHEFRLYSYVHLQRVFFKV